MLRTIVLLAVAVSLSSPVAIAGASQAKPAQRPATKKPATAAPAKPAPRRPHQRRSLNRHRRQA